MNENDYSEELQEVENLEEVGEVVEESTEEPQEIITYVVEESIDYSQQFETIIELQQNQINLLAQNNVNQLYVIGVLSALFVCVLLYNAIKKFI